MYVTKQLAATGLSKRALQLQCISALGKAHARMPVCLAFFTAAGNPATAGRDSTLRVYSYRPPEVLYAGLCETTGECSDRNGGGGSGGGGSVGCESGALETLMLQLSTEDAVSLKLTEGAAVGCNGGGGGGIVSESEVGAAANGAAGIMDSGGRGGGSGRESAERAAAAAAGATGSGGERRQKADRPQLMQCVSEEVVPGLTVVVADRMVHAADGTTERVVAGFQVNPRRP